MKKALKVFGIVILLFFVFMAVILGVKATETSKETAAVKINNVDFKNVADGAYRGNYSVGLVKVEVTVQVKDKKITEIVINKHDNGLGKKAEKIVDTVIKDQSLAVETISGATTSSKVILKAIEDALTK